MSLKEQTMVDKEFAKLSIMKANLLQQEQTKEVLDEIKEIDQKLKKFSLEEQLANNNV